MSYLAYSQQIILIWCWLFVTAFAMQLFPMKVTFYYGNQIWERNRSKILTLMSSYLLLSLSRTKFPWVSYPFSRTPWGVIPKSPSHSSDIWGTISLPKPLLFIQSNLWLPIVSILFLSSLMWPQVLTIDQKPSHYSFAPWKTNQPLLQFLLLNCYRTPLLSP